jgi:sugar (pentulose or hexulose) kinase
VSFIGIDLGTTFIKAAVLDLDQYRLTHIRRVPFPEPISGLDPWRCEFDPSAILFAVQQLLRGMEEVSDHCEGMVMCTQMSCLVLMDEHGAARSNCIGWRDQRALQPHPSESGSYYEVLQQRISKQERKELGNEMPPGAPISFLFWWAEQRQLQTGLIPVSLADFVLSALCDSRPTVESTNGMAYELLNLTTMQWHHEVIRELGLNQLHWPTLVNHGEVVGRMKLRDRVIPCYTAVGDYQCALAGALLDENELSLNVSTGSQVSRLTRNLVLGDYQTRPFFDGRFTNTISHLPAGRSLNVLVELITEFARSQGMLSDPWEYIVRCAEDSETTDLKVDLGFFPGPCGNQGSVSNIREKNLNIRTLFNAAFENMAENYSRCADRIWPDRSWRNVVFSGGLARKVGILRSKVQRELKASCRLCPIEEDTLLGLMALALAFREKHGLVEEAMGRLRSHYRDQPDVHLRPQ